MKLLQKLDTYLLEKFPMLWHNKLIYALCYSLLLSILYFGWGYFYTSPNNIKHLSISDFLYRSDAFLCVIILNACFLILWALSFFRKTAVKNFYPLQKWYFTRLFLSFLLIFWSITWPVNTFHWGVSSKVRTIAPLAKLQNEIETINFANAFLFENDYSFENYIQLYHPSVRILNFDNNTQKWEDYHFELTQETKKAWKTEAYTYNATTHPENTIEIGNRKLQFIEVKERSNNDHCNPSTRTFFVKAHSLDSLCPNALYDLRNYSAIEMDSGYFQYPNHSSIFEQYANRNYNRYHSYYYAEKAPVNGSIENQRFNHQFAKFVATSSKESIEQVLNRYQKLLNELQINYSLDNQQIAEYVFKHSKNMTFKPLVGSSFNDQEKARLDWMKYKSLDAYQQMRETHGSYTQPLFFVEKSQLGEVYSNARKAHDPIWNWDYLIISSYFAVVLSFFIFLFAIGHAINIVIASAIGGVLAILNTLFFVVFLESYSYSGSIDFKLFSQLLVFSAILFTMLYFFYKSKRVNKRILLILFNLCYALVCLLPLFLMQFADSILRYQVNDSCYNSTTVHSIFYHWSSDPIMNLIFVLGAIISFSLLIKPILAKPE